MKLWLFICLISFWGINGDDSQAIINGKKAVHVIDERFLSISIDPALLFYGIKFGENSLKLAQHLSPSYLRIAGPSTAYLSFSEDETKSTDHLDEDTKSLDFTASMWRSLNEWVQRSNFTPVFALNDQKRVNGKWDPKSVEKFLEVTAGMDIPEIYWQLGYDSTEKSKRQYKEELAALGNVLNQFPDKKKAWKIVGSDFSAFIPSAHADLIRRYVDELKATNAIFWEPQDRYTEDIFETDPMDRHLMLANPKIPIWKTAMKNEHPVTFNDAIDWAVQIGEAAKKGYDVIYRTPRLHELFRDSAAYWVSMLHKNLMGCNVLDVKTSSIKPIDTHVYAHCSKNQNSYSVGGAMTFMIINNGTEEHKTSLKVAGTQMKNIEVRSYVLTSKGDDSLDTYLNGDKLSMDSLIEEGMIFTPKLRRAKATTHLSLIIPARSIGFFVLPGARIPVCISDEDETHKIIEEINKDQIDQNDIPNMVPRISRKSSGSLNDIYNLIEKEIEEDEKIYKSKISKTTKIEKGFKMPSLLKAGESTTEKLEEKKSILKDEGTLNDVKKFFEKAKERREETLDKLDLPKFEMGKVEIPKIDFKNLLSKKEEITATTTTTEKGNFDFTSSEILTILKNRNQAKAEKRVGLGNTELDEIINKVFKNKLRNKRSAKGHGRRGQPKKRHPRDINMALLNSKIGDKDGEKKLTIIKTRSSDDNAKTTHKKEHNLDDLRTILMEQHQGGFPIFPTLITFPGLQGRDVPVFPKIPHFLLGHKHKSPEAVTKKIEDSYSLNDASDDFLEKFGDDIKIIKSKDNKNLNKDFWEFGEGGKYPDNSDLAEGEFVINKYDPEEIEKTMKELESYLNHKAKYDFTRYKRQSTKAFNPHSNSHNKLKRNRRNLSGFDQHLNSHNKKKLFRNRRSQIKPLLLKPLSTYKLGDDDSEEFDETKYEPQIRFLKSRLAISKKIDESKPSFDAQNFQRKIKEAFDKLDFNKRKTRSASDAFDVRYDEVYVPNVEIRNAHLKEYESKFDKIKEWKPEDILKLPMPIKKTASSIGDKGNSLEEINKRMPRRADVNSVENAIDDFLNVIEKDTKFMKPLLDKESGEYTILFPTKDKISLIQTNGDTKIKIHKSGDKNTPEAQTCVASTDEIVDETTITTDEINAEPTTEQVKTVSEYILKIEKGNQEHEFVMFEKVMQTVNGFIEMVQKKVNQFFQP